MTQARLYALAILGAVLGAAGDLAGVAAARGVRPWALHAVGVACWSACYPVWLAMSRGTGGGFADAAAAWSVAGAAFTASIAIIMREPQSRLQWLGLLLVLLGAATRGIGAR